MKPARNLPYWQRHDNIVVEADMGTITSKVNIRGQQVNGIVLGEPAEVDGMYAWDHPLLPSYEAVFNDQAGPSLMDVDMRLVDTEAEVDELAIALLGG